MSEQLALKVTSSLDDLGVIAAAVNAMGQREKWSSGLVFNVNLVLEELVINVHHHGHDGGVHEIEIKLDSEPGRLKIEVIDDGRPFDPLRDAALPDTNRSLEDRAVGGLGLYLVRSVMDEMQYKREQGKNRVILVARRDR